jgi:hypothetical protein
MHVNATHERSAFSLVYIAMEPRANRDTAGKEIFILALISGACDNLNGCIDFVSPIRPVSRDISTTSAMEGAAGRPRQTDKLALHSVAYGEQTAFSLRKDFEKNRLTSIVAPVGLF